MSLKNTEEERTLFYKINCPKCGIEGNFQARESLNITKVEDMSMGCPCECGVRVPVSEAVVVDDPSARDIG